MGKQKHTLESVRINFENEEYILLSDKYSTTTEKLSYICKKHPEEIMKITYKHFLRGVRCKYCSLEKQSFKKRIDYRTVQSLFEEKGYILLETEYINSKTPMKYQCHHHPDKETTITYNDIRNGSGCGYCYGNKKLTLEEAKKLFKEKNYELLALEYINSVTKMEYSCPNHLDKKLFIRLSELNSGHGCPYCAGNVKYTIEEVRLEFEKRGYTLLEHEYKNIKKKMKFRCPNHAEKDTKISFDVLLRGHGCSYCGGTGKLTYKEVKDKFEERGYELISQDYTNASTKLKYRCPKHPDKILFIDYHGLNKGEGCRLCANEENSERFRGENSHFWKGGVTELNNYLRKMLDDWKKASLNKYDYKCIVTGENGDMEVHHIESYNLIRDKIFSELNIEIKSQINQYPDKELKLISSSWLKYHRENLGVPMLKQIHKLFHSIYGFDNNEGQVNEFIKKYKQGEFKEVI